MILPGETEAGTAGTQPCRGISRRAHRDDERGREDSFLRRPTSIGSKDPHALKIPARRAEYSLTENVASPFQAEPRHNQPRIFAFMSPTTQGAQSISGAGEAVAFGQAVREHLGQLLKKHGLRETRIFFYGPFALAVFLGQQLTSVGEIQLFEYQDPGYVLTCSMKT